MILVTGGAGFIGSNFVLNWLAQSDEPVVNLDKLTYAGNRANLQSLDGDPRHVFVRGDVADSRLVSEILAVHRPRAVLNFAAESHVDRAIQQGEEFIQTNVVGVFRLLEAARAYWAGLAGTDRSAFRFLQVSTDEVYGSLSPDAVAFTERDRYEPNNPYAASKAAADHLVRASHRTYGLPVLTTNCANNYGPYQYPEKLIPHMITAALAGEVLPIYGNGRQLRDWLHVADHCNAIRMVLASGVPGETYNIGAHAEKANLDVIHSICCLLDELCPTRQADSYRAQIVHVTDRPGHDQRYSIDATKIMSQLGWRASHTFESGLRETVCWYLGHAAWVDGVKSRAALG
ncbi:MAG: dTDP-glucose 4,6-dehydratase [Polaromonas sp.]|nr:dTDP-glucose 4,6-dehydratase [Polaromonas sp.]